MSWSVEKYKRGKRKVGCFCTNSETGKVVFIAYKRHKNIFKAEEKSISEAMRKGVACWGIDNEALQMSRIKGVSYVGAVDVDNGKLYLAPIGEFYNLSNMKFTAKGSQAQKYLPLQFFKISKGITNL